MAGPRRLQKSSGSGCGEATIQVTTTPTTVNSHVEPPSPGPDFPLNITISSGIPAAGVAIEVTARPETPAGAELFLTWPRAVVPSAAILHHGNTRIGFLHRKHYGDVEELQ